MDILVRILVNVLDYENGSYRLELQGRNTGASVPDDLMDLPSQSWTTHLVWLLSYLCQCYVRGFLLFSAESNHNEENALLGFVLDWHHWWHNYGQTDLTSF